MTGSSAAPNLHDWDAVRLSGIARPGHSGGYETGVSFTVSERTVVSGIRFRVSSPDDRRYVVDLWSAAGVLQASGTSRSVAGTGWQTIPLDREITLSPGREYVAAHWSSQTRPPTTSSEPIARSSTIEVAGTVYRKGRGFPDTVGAATDYPVELVVRPVPQNSSPSPTTVPSAPSTSAVPTATPTTTPTPPPTQSPSPAATDGGYVVGSGASAKRFPAKPGLTTPESELKAYTGPGTLTSGDHVIENAVVSKQLELPRGSTATLTLRNVKFQAASTYQVIARGGTVHAEHLLVDGARNSNEPAVVIEGGGWIRLSEVVNVANPIRLGSNGMAEWNYLHAFPAQTNEGSAHSDGIEVYSGAREDGAPSSGPHVFVLNNYIELGNAEGANASINLTNDFDTIDGARVEGNTMLAGGNYALYIRSDGYCGCGGSNRNIEIVNNRWFGNAQDKWGGYYGTHSYQPREGVTAWSGNTLTRPTGEVVSITLNNAQP
jgi:Domain of unknown function (DUF4082)